jgi:hypothetical protein
MASILTMGLSMTDSGGGTRKIKFRQFHAGKFHYWGFYDDGNGAIWQGPITKVDPKTEAPIPSEQYTGRKDINGVEIYEGDILADRDGEIMGVVIWDGNGWFLKGDEQFYYGPNEYAELQDRLDPCIEIGELVIGNSHEPPEILNDSSR